MKIKIENEVHGFLAFDAENDGRKFSGNIIESDGKFFVYAVEVLKESDDDNNITVNAIRNAPASWSNEIAENSAAALVEYVEKLITTEFYDIVSDEPVFEQQYLEAYFNSLVKMESN